MPPTSYRKIVLTAAVITFSFLTFYGNNSPAHAQVDLGADLVSRYVWRGFDFGDAVSIQPTVSYSRGGFQIGTWASYAFGAQSSAATEHDLWAAYAFDFSNGSRLGVGVTDYYFPNSGVKFFNLSHDGGAHQIEPYLSFSGPSSFPLNIWASVFIHNEPDHASYLEMSYPFTVEPVDLNIALGGSPASSDFYLNPGGPAITKLSLSASKSASITDSFSIPLSIQYILNPHQEVSYLVFGISF